MLPRKADVGEVLARSRPNHAANADAIATIKYVIVIVVSLTLDSLATYPKRAIVMVETMATTDRTPPWRTGFHIIA